MFFQNMQNIINTKNKILKDCYTKLPNGPTIGIKFFGDKIGKQYDCEVLCLNEFGRKLQTSQMLFKILYFLKLIVTNQNIVDLHRSKQLNIFVTHRSARFCAVLLSKYYTVNIFMHDLYSLSELRRLKYEKRFIYRIKIYAKYLHERIWELILNKICFRLYFISRLDKKINNIYFKSNKGLACSDYKFNEDKSVTNTSRIHNVLISIPLIENAMVEHSKFILKSWNKFRKSNDKEIKVTLFGEGASSINNYEQNLEIRRTKWVDDYKNFLSGFDLFIYPRFTGAGFHYKVEDFVNTGKLVLTSSFIRHTHYQPNRPNLRGFRTIIDLVKFLEICLYHDKNI